MTQLPPVTLPPNSGSSGTIAAGYCPDKENQSIHSEEFLSQGSMEPGWARELFSEFIGTLLLVGTGMGVTSQFILSSQISDPITHFALPLGWGLGIGCGILVAGPISGAHLNPALSIAFAAFGKLPWLKVPGYILSQCMGAFVAAALIFTIHFPALQNFDNGTRQLTGDTASLNIFVNSPNPASNIYASFLAELIGTCYLALGLLTLTSQRNNLPIWAVAGGAAALLTTVGMSLGFMTGCSLNPARDFGPRLFVMMAGYGPEVFITDNMFFWIPLIAPILGALLATFVHDFLLDRPN